MNRAGRAPPKRGATISTTSPRPRRRPASATEVGSSAFEFRLPTRPAEYLHRLADRGERGLARGFAFADFLSGAVELEHADMAQPRPAPLPKARPILIPAIARGVRLRVRIVDVTTRPNPDKPGQRAGGGRRSAPFGRVVGVRAGCRAASDRAITRGIGTISSRRASPARGLMKAFDRPPTPTYNGVRARVAPSGGQRILRFGYRCPTGGTCLLRVVRSYRAGTRSLASSIRKRCVGGGIRLRLPTQTRLRELSRYTVCMRG